jgi:hypothetical protein
MRIQFSQSGGFVGIPRVYEIDTDALPRPERDELEGLVAVSDLAGSWERTSAAGRDLRQYEIRIDGAGPPVHVCCDERCLPEAARPLVAFLAARAGPPPAAKPRWGRFDGRVVATWHEDGRNMTLTRPFAYVDPRETRWEAAAGSVVNGASIPRPFWSLIGGPFSGRFRNASVVHDVACETRDQPWRATHRMFYEACRCGRVAVVKAKTMYYAVHHFGPRWRIEERRTLVAGRPVVERIVHDETPPPPSAATVAAVERYFAAHDVDDAAIPALLPEMVSDGG